MKNQPNVPDEVHLKPVESTTLLRSGKIDTGWHRHAEHQLLYAEGGVLYVFTNNYQFLLPAYHGAWIPGGCAHKLVSPSDKIKLWFLYFSPKKQESVNLKSVRIFGVSRMAREMLLFTERWSDGDGDSQLAQSFYETIRLLAVEWCEKPLALVLPHIEEGLLSEVTNYMLHNLGEPLDIEAVAQIHNVSGRTLMRLFRQQLDMTFGTYLRVARIVKAVELLTLSAKSISEVAYDVGYSSPSSFTHAFHELTGMSPREYAKTR